MQGHQNNRLRIRQCLFEGLNRPTESNNSWMDSLLFLHFLRPKVIIIAPRFGTLLILILILCTRTDDEAMESMSDSPFSPIKKAISATIASAAHYIYKPQSSISSSLPKTLVRYVTRTYNRRFSL